jgi:hypothetical protein
MCFTTAGYDTSSAGSAASQFIWKTYDFCHSARPNLYDLLSHLAIFMTNTNAPVSFDKMPPQVTAVVAAYRDVFTSTPGLNQPTTSPAQTSRPGLSSSGASAPGAIATSAVARSASWNTSPTPRGSIPTQYLSQLPPNWPYTSHGLTHSTASWPLTQPDTSSTIAWVLAAVSWFPRPLLARQNLLEHWSHALSYETVTVTTPPPPSIVTSQMRSTFPPSITQGSVLPKEPDSDAEIRASMASARSRPGTKTLVQGMTAAPDAQAGVVSELEGVVESVRSRLGEMGRDR